MCHLYPKYVWARAANRDRDTENVLLSRLIKTRAKRSWESHCLWSRWIVRIHELDRMEKHRRSAERSEKETRESSLVVKREQTGIPDTFVGLARTYAHLDKRDRYDRYSLVLERYTLTGLGLMDLLVFDVFVVVEPSRAPLCNRDVTTRARSTEKLLEALRIWPHPRARIYRSSEANAIAYYPDRSEVSMKQLTNKTCDMHEMIELKKKLKSWI